MKKRNTQFTVKYCNSCKYAWERWGEKLIEYWDFPTYGLQRKICSKCIKKERDMEDFSYA